MGKLEAVHASVPTYAVPIETKTWQPSVLGGIIWYG